MELIIDPDVRSVLEFMQERLPACKLVPVAKALLGMATLLWGHYSQEPCQILTLESPKRMAHQSQSDAIESGPAPVNAGGGSVVAKDGL